MTKELSAICILFDAICVEEDKRVLVLDYFKEKQTMSSRTHTHKQRVSLLLWPFYAIWKLVSFIVGMTGRLVAITIGIALVVVGIVLTLTIVGAGIGLPIGVFGMLLISCGIFW